MWRDNEMVERIPLRVKQIDHLTRKIIVREDGCHVWTGTISQGGYGVMVITDGGKRIRARAHRIAYQIAHGEIPDGLYVCHSCDVKLCVNPDHLFAATQAENMRDMSRKSRARNEHNYEASPVAIEMLKRGAYQVDIQRITGIPLLQLRELARHVGVELRLKGSNDGRY